MSCLPCVCVRTCVACKLIRALARARAHTHTRIRMHAHVCAHSHIHHFSHQHQTTRVQVMTKAHNTYRTLFGTRTRTPATPRTGKSMKSFIVWERGLIMRACQIARPPTAKLSTRASCRFTERCRCRKNILFF